MRPSGSAGLAVLLLFGSACGDSVVVARGVSLVSAAVETSDAGLLGDAGTDDSTPGFESGHGGAPGHHPPSSFAPSPRPASTAHDSAGGGGGSGGNTGTSEAGTGGAGGTSSAKHH